MTNATGLMPTRQFIAESELREHLEAIISDGDFIDRTIADWRARQKVKLAKLARPSKPAEKRVQHTDATPKPMGEDFAFSGMLRRGSLELHSAIIRQHPNIMQAYRGQGLQVA